MCGSPLFLVRPHNVTSARTCTVAESTGSLAQGRTALLTAQAGLVLGNALPGKEDDCALKADWTPSGLASVTSSRHVLTDCSAAREITDR